MAMGNQSDKPRRRAAYSIRRPKPRRKLPCASNRTLTLLSFRSVGHMPLFHQLKQAVFGSGRPRLRGKAQLALPSVPFYELDPLPWWSKKGWTYFFVASDAMITYVSNIHALADSN